MTANHNSPSTFIFCACHGKGARVGRKSLGASCEMTAREQHMPLALRPDNLQPQVSPKAWTRKGQAEIAVQRKETLAKEEVKNGVVHDLAAIKKVRNLTPSRCRFSAFMSLRERAGRGARRESSVPICLADACGPEVAEPKSVCYRHFC
jgi:hypothetical protein